MEISNYFWDQSKHAIEFTSHKTLFCVMWRNWDYRPGVQGLQRGDILLLTVGLKDTRGLYLNVTKSN